MNMSGVCKVSSKYGVALAHSQGQSSCRIAAGAVVGQSCRMPRFSAGGGIAKAAARPAAPASFVSLRDLVASPHPPVTSISTKGRIVYLFGIKVSMSEIRILFRKQ